MFINTALGALGLALLFLLIAQAMNRLMPERTVRLYRAWQRQRAGLTAAVQPLQGLQTPYLHGGKGEVLVMLHGFAADKDRFYDLARHLKDHTRLLIPEMAGHGDADKDPGADYSVVAQVERVRAFVHSHKLATIHLGGIGMGGTIAAWYAARYPDEVASLWLLNASATQDAWQAPWVQTYDATGHCPMIVQTLEEHLAKWKLGMDETKYLPYCVLHAWATAGARDFALHKTMFKAMRQTPPLENHYTGLQTPALIVGGELDRLVPAASVRTLAKVFTRAQAMVVQDLGHLPHLESPAQIAQDYVAFRAKLVAGSRH